MAETGGTCAAVSDAEVIQGMKLLARTEGIFAETAGGVTIAGLKRMAESGHIRPDEVTVVFITGAGLKTVEAVIDELEPPLTVEPTMASFEEALGERAIGERNDVAAQEARSA